MPQIIIQEHEVPLPQILLKHGTGLTQWRRNGNEQTTGPIGLSRPSPRSVGHLAFCLFFVEDSGRLSEKSTYTAPTVTVVAAKSIQCTMKVTT